ncbi:MAG: PilZ domain-containing protein [Gammaproteobacteria bacterium]
MNHRFSVRVPLRVEVKLSRHGNDLGRYMTRDIDSDGAYLETGQLVVFPNEIVDVGIRFPGENSGNLSIKGMIVRTTSQGIGLMFTESSEELDRHIGRLIQELLEIEMVRSPAERRRAVG